MSLAVTERACSLETCVLPGSTINSLERFSHAHNDVQRLWDPWVLHVTVYCVRIFRFFFSHKTTGYHFNVMKISSFFFFFVKPMSPQIFKILFSLVIWKHILQFRRTRFKVTHYIIHNIVRKRPFLMHCIEIWTSSHFFGWQKKCLSWYMQFSFDIWVVISRTHVNNNVYA